MEASLFGFEKFIIQNFKSLESNPVRRTAAAPASLLAIAVAKGAIRHLTIGGKTQCQQVAKCQSVLGLSIGKMPRRTARQ